MIAPLAFYFYYIALTGSSLTVYTELGPFGTYRECKTDQQYYLAEGGTISECYQR